MSRTCPFNDCGVAIPSDKFACYPHWQTLDTNQKNRIWTSYRRYRSGAASLAELREAQRLVLAEAQDKCAEARTDYHQPKEGRCNSCGAVILWATTLAGKTMPLDLEPHADGNIALTPAGAMVLTKSLAEQGKAAGTRRYLSHFATCPNAARHRK